MCSHLTVYFQHKFGVRFFVPQYFLPIQYNYSRSVDHLFPSTDSASAEERGGEDEGLLQKECVICYNVIEESQRESRDYMVRCDVM